MARSPTDYAGVRSQPSPDESSLDSRSTKRVPRILVQYFRGHTLICELKINGESVHLHISPDGGARNDADRWQIEARTKIAGNEIVVGGTGPTRRAAFTKMSTRWSAQGSELELRPLDWDAVAVLLTAVRALE